MAVTLEPSSRTKPTRTARTEAAASAAAKIVPASASSRIKACIYARNKVGKTRFACSSDLKTLVIDCNERGTASVRKQKNVDVYPVVTWEDIDPIYWYLRTENHGYEVLAIDTVTMLAMIGMKFVLKDDFDRDMTRDPMTPDKRSWGKLGEMLKDAIIKFRNLDMHVIFLAQEKTTTTEDDDGGTILETHPELSPAPRSVLLSSVDMIGRLYTREVEQKGKKIMERRMLLAAHPKYVAGNRYDELKPIERNPTLGSFLARINGEMNAGSNA